MVCVWFLCVHSYADVLLGFVLGAFVVLASAGIAARTTRTGR